MSTVPSRAVKVHQPCKDCGSSDALTLYDDGHTHCFSCGKTRRGEGGSGTGGEGKRRKGKMVGGKATKETTKTPLYFLRNSTKDTTTEEYNTTYSITLGNIGSNPPISRGEIKNISSELKKAPAHRGLTQNTLQQYGVVSTPDEKAVVFDYGEGRKIRPLDRKAFWTEGSFKDAKLFGQGLFNAGSAKSITLTEGEYDAMAVYQMMGSQYPCVSVRSGAPGARGDCEKERDYLNSFEKIYLCFDNDEPGQKAAHEVAQLFDPNKVYIVHLDKLKDANDYLVKGLEKEFTKAWWNAKRWRPKGIVSGYDEIANILKAPSAGAVATLPFRLLNEKMCGIRLGEINLFTALEGVGKTEVMGAIEHHLLKETDFNIAIIHLEEPEKKAIQRLVTYETGVGVHRPETTITPDDQIDIYKNITKRDDRVYYYRHFGSDDDDIILDIIRHLVVVHRCKFVFLDHITILVTGLNTNEQTQRLDYLSTRLGSMVGELDFTLFLVSHENDDGKTRGSRNISKIANLWVQLSRDVESADEDTRLTTVMTIKKNRFGSDTGPGGKLKFDRKSFRLQEVQEYRYADASFPNKEGGGAASKDDPLGTDEVVAYSKLF